MLKIIHRGVGFCELLMVGRLFYQWSDSTYCNSISTFSSGPVLGSGFPVDLAPLSHTDCRVPSWALALAPALLHMWVFPSLE